MIGEYYFECGIEFFEAYKYEEAILSWIRAYNLGYKREIILENIYNCFILPNEQEFRCHYKQNSENLTHLPYESCSLDFIPICENRFYIYDKEENCFRGLIILEGSPIQGKKIEFNNILFTDTWDIREILSDRKEYSRDELYLRDVILFQDGVMMRIS